MGTIKLQDNIQGAMGAYILDVASDFTNEGQLKSLLLPLKMVVHIRLQRRNVC